MRRWRTIAESRLQACIFIGGNNQIKDQVQRQIEQTQAFTYFQSHVPESGARLLAELHQLYPLAPMDGSIGGWFDYVVPTCTCQFYKEKDRDRQQGMYPPNQLQTWCVHTAAVMFKLAYMVQDNPIFLANLHGFETWKPPWRQPPAKKHCPHASGETTEEDKPEVEAEIVHSVPLALHKGSSIDDPIEL